MLVHLHISNFAIVPELDLDLREGFTAITGETGAGKSILVDALSLLLGDRSDASWVRSGEERAELGAEFSVRNNEAVQDWLDRNELAAGGDCLLRRTINSSGRSRGFVNGTAVTVAQMQSLGQLLVEIHGQNEHLRLTRSAEQFKLLDGSGGYPGELFAVHKAFGEWKSANDELLALEQEAEATPGDLDFLQFQLNELQQHELSQDALNALETEHDRLAAGEALMDTLTQCLEMLEPESPAAGAGVHSDINAVLTGLQTFRKLDDHIDEASQMLQEAAINCDEASRALRLALKRVDPDPKRFKSVAHTLSQLNDLARKHRVPVAGLERLRQELETRIERASRHGELRDSLAAELEERLKIYREAARALHAKRKKHAAGLSAEVIRLMAELGMAGGEFELAVHLDTQAKPSSRGDDRLQINISANPGSPPGPLGKIASGGELSRISLAIKVAAAGGIEAVTQIFDEVDAGIGGDTANAVGHLMKRLAGNGQTLCVTHLAQVAVCATHQLQVSKRVDGESAVVDTKLLDAEQRVDEIARMLSGKLSEQSRAHALELLEASA